MSKIKVTFVETNCKKNGPIKQTLNIIRNMDKEVFEPSLVTVWPEDADNSMIDEYKKLGIPVLSANMSKKKSVLFGKKEVGQLLEQLQPAIREQFTLSRSEIIAMRIILTTMGKFPEQLWPFSI